MSAPFDPYHVWLGIPPEEQPASRYRLLGIRPFEAVADVIDNAADRQTAHLRTVQAGQHIKLAERLLNEIAAARVCLLNPEKKAQYDRELRAAATAAMSQAGTLPQAAAGSAIRRTAAAEPLAAQTGTDSTAGAGANMAHCSTAHNRRGPASAFARRSRLGCPDRQFDDDRGPRVRRRDGRETQKATEARQDQASGSWNWAAAGGGRRRCHRRLEKPGGGCLGIRLAAGRPRARRWLSTTSP